jgi:hypothetical protein
VPDDVPGPGVGPGAAVLVTVKIVGGIVTVAPVTVVPGKVITSWAITEEAERAIKRAIEYDRIVNFCARGRRLYVCVEREC